LWQSWRDRRKSPAKPIPSQKLRINLTAIATWNINGFWSKNEEVRDLLIEEKVAVLALQETLVGRAHYPIQMSGYRVYQSAAEEDFRGTAVLIDEKLASYKHLSRVVFVSDIPRLPSGKVLRRVLKERYGCTSNS